MSASFPHSANELLVMYSLARERPTERNFAMVWAYYRYTAWDLLRQYDAILRRPGGEHPHMQLELDLITQTMQAWGFSPSDVTAINHFDDCCERAYANLSEKQRRGL